MSISKVADIVKATGDTITGLVSDLTGLQVGEKITGGLKGITDKSADLVKEVPLAGGLSMYVFKRSGKGILVLGKRVDKVVKTLGDLANTVVGTAQDTVVWTLMTTRGSVRQVGKTLGSINGSKKGGRRRSRRRSRRKSSKRHKSRRRRKR